jgi:hypothetical protein
LRASFLAVSPPGSAQCITEGKLSALHDTYSTRCHRKVKKIIKDNNHPSHCLFTPPEGEVSTGASKLGPRDSFYLKAIRLPNINH